MIGKKSYDVEVVNAIKSLGIDMINKAKSGHPGIVLGAAPIIYTLYSRHINVFPDDPEWANRDRFVLSAGHGSALLYSTLHLAGFNLTIKDLKSFRQLNSKTPGHPEHKVTPGVDASTGPLGQGIANAVGMAIAETHDIEAGYYTYVLASDGDLMEGISYEAASLAGTLKLNKLIVLYDSNDITLDGKLEKTFNESVQDRFNAQGWQTLLVKNGENIDAIDKAIQKAKKETRRPTVIEIKTTIGKGSKLEGTNKIHGSVPVEEDYKKIKEQLGYTNKEFKVEKSIKEYLKNKILDRTKEKYEKVEQIKQNIKDINKVIEGWPDDLDKSTREINSILLNEIAKHHKTLIGGSADLSSSNKTYLNDAGDYNKNNRVGKNIWYGVREHAMGGITNGLALAGLRPYCATFLTFSDYLKPSIRLAALQNLPVIYIFTHDSIDLGEDGPTHQPIEQLAGLRSIPNLDVYRPADAKELVGTWNAILKQTNKPSVIVLGRNKAKLLKNTSDKKTENGAYIVRKETAKLDAIIIATGSDLEKAVYINSKHKNIRIVSMPCMETFLTQTKKYQEEVLPKNTKTFVIEAGSSFGWHRFVEDEKHLLTINEFGKSAPKEELLKDYKFDKENLLKRIKELL